jgi:hypothetical protein
MSIAEILANKRKALQKVEIKEKEDKEDDFFFPPFKTLNYEEVDKKLFLAMYAPYIRNPYAFDWFAFIRYKDFLFPDGAYILNTFQQLDIDLILESYIYAYEPSTLKEYSILCCFLNHLHLNVPKEYEKDIIQLIYSTEKNP